MSLYLEMEGNTDVPFDAEETARLVVQASLEYVECPFESEVSILITNDDEIHEMNRQHRGIDRATDVLSFPMLEYEKPGDFSGFEDKDDYFNPESGELMLGDIVLSMDRILQQAQEYGHSPRREYAFLIAHSMLHLFGFDHMEDEERLVMEQKQREIMERIGIMRQ